MSAKIAILVDTEFAFDLEVIFFFPVKQIGNHIEVVGTQTPTEVLHLLLHGEVCNLPVLEVLGIRKESALRAGVVQVVPLGGVFRLQVVHPQNAIVDVHFLSPYKGARIGSLRRLRDCAWFLLIF